MHPADLTVALYSERRVMRYKGSLTYDAYDFLLIFADCIDFLSDCKVFYNFYMICKILFRFALFYLDLGRFLKFYICYCCRRKAHQPYNFWVNNYVVTVFYLYCLGANHKTDIR